MRLSLFPLVVTLAVLSFMAPASTRGEDGAKPLSEEQKIKSLIATVRGLKDATFVRNGDEHDCAAAAGHMERKWKAGRKQIKTARDFIRLAASTSSKSGEPYLIRFKDGTEQASEAFLTAELDKLEGKDAEDGSKKEEG